MKINIGGGHLRFDGFLNVDSDPLSNPDIFVDIEKDIFPIEDNMVEEVKAHHILEHIGDGYFHLLKELYRICKDSAIIDIIVPHHRNENWYWDSTHKRYITVDGFRQFSKKFNKFNSDKWNRSSGYAERLGIDFEIVSFDFIPDGVWEERFKTMSQEDIIEVSRNFNNVYLETHIKLMVIKDA